MARRQHHADRPAHGVADHGGLVEPLFGDIAGQVLGHWRGDGPRGVVFGRRAGEALHMDAVHTVAALQLFSQQVEGVGRGGQAGYQDDVADRMLGSVDPHVEPARFEVGMGVAVTGLRCGSRAMVAVRLGEGGRRGGEREGPGEGGEGGHGLHGL